MMSSLLTDRNRFLLILLSWLTVAGASLPAQEKPLVFKGAKIHSATGPAIAAGVLVVENGKITAIGSVDQVQIPKDANVLDADGLVIIPGLVDSHSHLGVYSRPAIPANSDGNEGTGPVQTGVRALDAINPLDPGIKMAQAGGITSANIMPGSANVIGGQTLYVKLRGNTVDEMMLAGRTLGGLKMANGENPKRSYGSKNQAPGTRMKVAALQRSEFIKAQDYQRRWSEHRAKLARGEKTDPPAVNLELEPLVEVLERKRTVHFHSHRADDILTTVRLAEEFGFELIVQHGTEGYKVADELGRRKIPVSMTLLDSPGGKAEVVQMLEECGAQLAKAGVPVLINTDDMITESRFFLRTAAIAVRGGLTPEQGLQSVTILPARAMGLDEKIGSLEVGKDADFVVLSGEPFSVYTRVIETYIDGKRVFNLNEETSGRHQTGGFALPTTLSPPKPRPQPRPLPAVSAPTGPEGKQPTRSMTECVILAGRCHPVSGPPLEDAAIHVKGGRIAWIGARTNFTLPAGVPVLTAVEVTPGLIDPFTVVPLSGEYNIPADLDHNEMSDPIQPDLRVLDAFHPYEPIMRFLLTQGVTVVHATPGSNNVIAGQTGVFRTHGTSAAAMTLKFPYSLLVNLGELSKDKYPGKRPGTRMGTSALVRNAFTEAANYRRKMQAGKPDDRPERNLKHEALAAALDGKTRVLFAAHRSHDLLTALRLSDEFKLKSVLGLATEGYLAADAIAAAKLPVILHPAMQRVLEWEAFNTCMGNAAELSDKGLLLGMGSGAEGYVPKTRVARYEAAMAGVYGLGMEKALRLITLDAANILGIGDRFGSLDIGKVADLVLYDSDPFEHATHVTHVLVDGNLVYDRRQDRPASFARLAYFSSPEMPCCLGW